MTLQILSFISLLIAVPSFAGEVAMPGARDLTAELLRYEENHHLMGNFSRGDAEKYGDSGTLKMLGELGDLVSEGLGKSGVAVTEARFGDHAVSLRLKNSDRELVLSASRGQPPVYSHGAPQAPAFAESLSLALVDADLFKGTGGSFLQIVQPHPLPGEAASANVALEAGQSAGAFTLSVFSRETSGSLDNCVTLQNGGAVSLSTPTIGGIVLSVRLEASESTTLNTTVRSGKIIADDSGIPGGMLRLELSREFKFVGVALSGGIKFIASGTDPLTEEPLQIAFMRLSKSFDDQSGQEIASVQFEATREVDAPDASDWMVSLGFSIAW